MVFNHDRRKWVTSFHQTLPSGTLPVVDDLYSVVTVLSGNSSHGTHSSMLLEYRPEGTSHMQVAELIDLNLPDGKNISIQRQRVQEVMYISKQITLDNPAYWETLLTLRHHSYSLNEEQTANLLRAITRFETKVSKGRYVYLMAGGALGAIFSLPGRRAINCSDFVIKVLAEAGIVELGYRLFDTPYRIAK